MTCASADEHEHAMPRANVIVSLSASSQRKRQESAQWLGEDRDSVACRGVVLEVDELCALLERELECY